jgi:hypothetical protein
MTPPSGLFRREAVEFHTGQQLPDGVLRVEAAWTRWAYWLVLVMLVAAAFVTATAHTSETTSGPALIDLRERTFVALVPGAASSDVHAGQTVHLDIQGSAVPTLTAQVRTAEVADEAAIRGAGFPPSTQPAVLLTGVLSPGGDVVSPPSTGLRGQAVVVLRTEKLLDLVLRQLNGTLGQEGDA